MTLTVPTRALSTRHIVGVVIFAWVAACGLVPSGCVTERCYANHDCRSSQVCSAEGKCTYECTVDADCGSNMDCVNRRCRPKPTQAISCPADMVNIGGAFCIDRFEASREDATNTSQGIIQSHAVSKPGVLPWRLTGPDSNLIARHACQAAGKDLCSAQQWQIACQGSTSTVYGYGDTYAPQTCNGLDTFGTDNFKLLPTGSLHACKSDWGVFDMNGNLWEHVLDGNNRTVRGGAFNCIDSKSNHRCDFVPGNWEPSAQGFRCCFIPSSSPSDPPLDASDATSTDDQGLDDGQCLDPDADDGALTDADPHPEDVHREALPIENGCPVDMVRVKAGELDFCIDKFEASRDDATKDSQGTSGVAASVQGVIPWFPIDLPEARQACERAGKHLCRADEWTEGCSGSAHTVYSYGNTYDPVICNGIDTFCDCDSAACSGLSQCPYPHCFNKANADGMGPCNSSPKPMVTGAFAQCHSSYELFDINGNLWELIDSDDGLQHLRGGAYNCIDSEAMHRCDYDAVFVPPARGFRCCKEPQ